MVIRVGLEPTTPSLRGSCSNQLSYRTRCFYIIPHFFEKWKTLFLVSAVGQIVAGVVACVVELFLVVGEVVEVG